MQVLITQGDFSNRDRYKYLSQTLQRLTSLGVVPVINGMWCVVGPGVWCVVCGGTLIRTRHSSWHDTFTHHM